MSNQSTFATGDKVYIGNGKVVWTITGIFPIDAKGQVIGTGEWANLSAQYNTKGYWQDMGRRVNLSKLTHVEAPK